MSESTEHRWSISVAGEMHVVALGSVRDITGPPDEFTVDGARHGIGGALGSGPWIADFTMGGSPARLTRRLFLPDVGQQLGQTARAVGRALPIALAARMVGGAGLAGGVDGAVAADSMASWMAYELSVADRHEGTWVVSGPYSAASQWTWVGPSTPFAVPADAGPADKVYSSGRIRSARLGFLAGFALIIGGLAIGNPPGAPPSQTALAVLLLGAGVVLLIGTIVLAYWWRSHPA